MTNFKPTLLAVAAMATMAGAVEAQTVTYSRTANWGPTANNNFISSPSLSTVFARSLMQADGTVIQFGSAQVNPATPTVEFQNYNRSAIWLQPGMIQRTVTSQVACNASGCYAVPSMAVGAAHAYTLTQISIAAYRTGSTTNNGLITTWTNQINAQTGQVATYSAAEGYVMTGAAQASRIGRAADGGYVSASGQVYSLSQANTWRLLNAGDKITISGQNFAVYTARSDGARTYFVNNEVVTQAKYEELKKLALVAEAQAEEEVRAKASKKKDDHVAERTRKTNATVAGAIAVNIIVDELVGEELEKHGAGFGASVGGQFEKPELNLGVAVDLGKHLGEDFDGVSVHAGVGVESGELTVGARKSWQVAEYVQVSVGATVGTQGVRVGPELMICNKYFGIGVAMWGPVPVPQVKVFGYTASVVPHLALANAVVGGSTIAYKAIRSEMKKPAAVEPASPVEPVKVEAVEVVADDASDDLGIED